MRIYVPATLAMLRKLVAEEVLHPLGGTAFALTSALRESYTSGDTEELEYVAMRDAARASLRLLAIELSGDQPAWARRVVIAADTENAVPRPDLDDAAVRVSGEIPFSAVAAVHIDDPEAEYAVRQAAAVVDEADLGNLDAEFVLGEAEDHELSWYDPSELAFMLELLDL
ncbi:DUF6912 family protein [Pseudonocardia spinosispora]|uniref:DUF6912 family protein n=1 Tax=Pseudonocardia spinosispora TaxID=103441 RepID=UPI00049004FD|nr:hypothetical protein [Pseudonocardia spinosispora]